MTHCPQTSDNSKDQREDISRDTLLLGRGLGARLGWLGKPLLKFFSRFRFGTEGLRKKKKFYKLRSKRSTRGSMGILFLGGESTKHAFSFKRRSYRSLNGRSADKHLRQKSSAYGWIKEMCTYQAIHAVA